jgi:uncharacterized protein (DUF433 family)
MIAGGGIAGSANHALMAEGGTPMIDWSGCPDVERVPGRVSGQWVVKDTRVLADAVVENADDYTPEQIATELYPDVGADTARRIIRYARAHQHASAP